MNKNIIAIVFLSCMFSLVFIGVSEQQMKESAAIFNTSWLDAIKSICIGIIVGILLRFRTVRSFFERWPLGPDYQRHLLQYGFGAILFGFFGACIIYFKFGELEYARIPLHASILGLCLISIFLADTVSSKFVYSEKGA